MSENRGEWLLTATGRQFFPFDPKPEDVDILDIAHALSRICRFGGHIKTGLGGIYSVAQHSVLVSKIVKPEHAMLGLLHDAAEAYIGDMIRPLKRGLPQYQDVEKRVERSVWTRLLVDHRYPIYSAGDAMRWSVAWEDVKRADRIALATERRDLMAPCSVPWKEDELGFTPNPDPIDPWEPEQARIRFLGRFRELGGET